MRRALIALTILAARGRGRGAHRRRQGPHRPQGRGVLQAARERDGQARHVIWARRQTGSDAIAGKRSRLLLYRSTRVDGKPNAVSGSLALPKGKPPKGGWPVITYAHGTTGSADACAPTRGYDAGMLVSYAYPLLRRWLKAGYAVVRTDYEGLGTPGVHSYLVGATEGRSVLDAVRAARTLEPRLSKRFVIAGHSQGGHAALFAASLAPELGPRAAPARHGRVRAGLAPVGAVPAHDAVPDAGRRARRDRRARLAGGRHRRPGDRRARPAHAAGGGAVPGDDDRVLRRARRGGLVRRPAAQPDLPHGRRPRPAGGRDRRAATPRTCGSVARAGRAGRRPTATVFKTFTDQLVESTRRPACRSRTRSTRTSRTAPSWTLPRATRRPGSAAG